MDSFLSFLFGLLLGFLLGPVDLGGHGSVLGGVVPVDLHELLEVELGGLEDLALPNGDVLERVDAGARLLDLLPDDLGDELADQLLEVARGGVLPHDLDHLSPDLTDLGALGVARALDLVHPLLRESDAEKSKVVIIGSLHVNVGLDQGLPLADQRAELVCGEVHAVELGEAVPALNVLAFELDLPEGLVLVLVQVGQRDLINPTLQTLGSDLAKERKKGGRVSATRK